MARAQRTAAGGLRRTSRTREDAPTRDPQRHHFAVPPVAVGAARTAAADLAVRKVEDRSERANDDDRRRKSCGCHVHPPPGTGPLHNDATGRQDESPSPPEHLPSGAGHPLPAMKRRRGSPFYSAGTGEVASVRGSPGSRLIKRPRGHTPLPLRPPDARPRRLAPSQGVVRLRGIDHDLPANRAASTDLRTMQLPKRPGHTSEQAVPALHQIGAWSPDQRHPVQDPKPWKDICLVHFRDQAISQFPHRLAQEYGPASPWKILMALSAASSQQLLRLPLAFPAHTWTSQSAPCNIT
jgi:hypothetical protein